MLIAPKDYEAYGLDPSDAYLPRKLEAIEGKIRRHTNNHFQVRAVRFEAASSGGVVCGSHPDIKAGDTVDVTASGVNDGFYTVESTEDGATVLSASLLDSPVNRVTLIRYPVDVIEGAVGILEYEAARPAKKADVVSETLSRHSVSYEASSGAVGAFAGYPERVTAFLKPYRKARF